MAEDKILLNWITLITRFFGAKLFLKQTAIGARDFHAGLSTRFLFGR